MKFLLCTDGSKHSQKALEEASVIIKGCNVDEVAIIHVYEKYYQAQACIEYVKCGSVLDLPCGDGFVTEIFYKHLQQS